MYRMALTTFVAVAPWITLFVVALRGGLSPFPWWQVAVAASLLLVIGHGVTVGFHRMLTHRSFVAHRSLKIALALLGSMSFQGSVIGWVADHRRHHRYADRPGDPHSPVWQGPRPIRGARGFWHAHAGWFFDGDPTPRDQYAADLLADRDLVLVDKLFVPCCAVTLIFPLVLGACVTGTAAGAWSAFVWGGVIRIGVSHNLTWAINSVCHRFGRRPFRTGDHSTNFAPLAIFTSGESYHNAHHAFPTLARHGVERGQIDTSAALIRLFERLGWATAVRWPTPELLATRRGAGREPMTL